MGVSETRFAAGVPKAKMGGVRTKSVKKSSHQVIEHYYSNTTMEIHLMKRMIQRGSSVGGISQEQERERRMDFVPDESAIKTDRVEEVNKVPIDMLVFMGMISELPDIVLKEEQAAGNIPPANRPS